MADYESAAQRRADVDLAGFREVVRHPRAHALILQQYRVGEYAGVVGLKRLLAEMRPEGDLHRAMEIHFRDEDRHSKVFTDWIYRLGVEPEPIPTEIESFFSNNPEEFRRNHLWIVQRNKVSRVNHDDFGLRNKRTGPLRKLFGYSLVA